MNTFNSDNQDTMLGKIIVYTYKYGLPIFYILGNIGNICGIAIFSRRSWKKNVCVFYLKTCLLLSTGYVNSTLLGIMLTFSFQSNFQNASNALCKLFYYLSYIFVSLYPTVLLLASIDRLLLSSQKIDTRLYSSKRLAYFSISVSTIGWTLYCIHILVKVSIQEIYPGTFLCYYELSKQYLDFLSYSLAVSNVACCVLMILLCVFAFKNVRHIRAVSRGKRAHGLRSMTKKDFQLLRCLYAQDVIYITCSMMLIAYNVYNAVTRNRARTPMETSVLNFLADLFNFFFTIPYMSNFLVFFTVSKAFRHELERLICKFIRRDLPSMREEEQRQDHVDLNIAVSTIELRR